MLLYGSVHDGLYKLHLSNAGSTVLPAQSAQCFSAHSMVSLDVWHYRLGHPCNVLLKRALSRYNIHFDMNKKVACCHACHLGKERKQPFPQSVSEYSAPLQFVAVDVWGPAPVVSNGFRYYVAFTDAYSRYTGIFSTKKVRCSCCVLSVS